MSPTSAIVSWWDAGSPWRTDVQRDPDGRWSARCTCGWTAESPAPLAMASRAAGLHADEHDERDDHDPRPAARPYGTEATP